MLCCIAFSATHGTYQEYKHIESVKIATNNFYCVKIKGAGDPERQSVVITCLLATRHTALRGQDLYSGFDKEQEKQGRR